MGKNAFTDRETHRSIDLRRKYTGYILFGCKLLTEIPNRFHKVERSEIITSFLYIGMTFLSFLHFSVADQENQYSMNFTEYCMQNCTN